MAAKGDITAVVDRPGDSHVAAFVYAEAAELIGTENAATGCGLARAHNLRELSPKPDKHAFAACGHVRGKADFTTVIDGARFEVEGKVAATWRRIIEKRYRREAVPRLSCQGDWDESECECECGNGCDLFHCHIFCFHFLLRL